MKQRRSAFTLIELLVVISIIALLSSVVLSSLNSARAKARDARRVSDIKQIQIALEMYYADNGEYPGDSDFAPNWPNISTLLVPKYLPKMPVDPLDPTSNWTWSYRYYKKYTSAGAGITCGGSWIGNHNYVLAFNVENPQSSGGENYTSPPFKKCVKN